MDILNYYIEKKPQDKSIEAYIFMELTLQHFLVQNKKPYFLRFVKLRYKEHNSQKRKKLYLQIRETVS